jgi:hypothetical protein
MERHRDYYCSHALYSSPCQLFSNTILMNYLLALHFTVFRAMIILIGRTTLCPVAVSTGQGRFGHLDIQGTVYDTPIVWRHEAKRSEP